MVRRDTPRVYNRTARSFHWLTALLVAMLFGIGMYMTRLDFSDWKVRVYSWHEWTGLVVFVTTGLRLAWRLLHPPPPLQPSPFIEQFAAHATHWAMYALMFLLPVLGFLGTNAYGFPITWFGVLPLPDPIGKNEALGRVLLYLHVMFAWLLAALLALHVAAALFHHFARGDGILARMLPGLKPRRGDD